MRVPSVRLALALAALVPALAAAQAPPPPAAAPAGEGALTASGLRYVSLREGTGEHPGADDIVRVNYRGTLADGSEFDSSYKRGKPLEFPLTRVIACWTEGVQLMRVGGKARLTCPPAIAYGARGAGGGAIPPNATLQFEIELLAIVSPRH